MKRLWSPFFVLVFTFSPALRAQGDFQRGLSYYKQGQYPRAIDEFEQILRTHSNYEDGYRILGDCYLKTKNYPKAISAFQSALRLKGDVFASYYGLALAYYNTGRYRDTASTLLRAESQARAPRDQYQLYRTRGSAYFNLKDFANAVADLQKAIAIQRGSVTDVLQLGISYYHLRNYSEAEPYLKQAIALDPNSAEARRYLSLLSFQGAVAAMESKNYQEAASLLRHHLANNPQDGEGWFNLGLAYLFDDNLKASEQAFLNAARFIPNNGEVYDRLGYICEKKKDYPKALRNYQKAYELTQDAQAKASMERVQERLRRRKESG